ncbi:hypothetical protein ILUMI_05534 [Ignelater luminosus]|uniref:Lipocalin/cytosolic fatty-acid binding domain-containing protein n=1 Tax=Ignelater luminosus TaxID=2038154 RepID=A0A8K0DHH7_IGNLU|nr:hypothetical protein ILUMI_05534 [Ignelater luminosus]
MAIVKKCAIVIVISFVLFDMCCPSGLGRCPRHEFVKNFSITKFAGHWYEIERSFYLMELTVSCTTLDLTENAKGQLEVDVKTLSRWTGSVRASEGVATPSRKDPSLLLYRVNSALPNALAKYLPGAGFYQILDTDYDKFAVLWTCTSLGLVHADRVWILGREKEIDVTLRAKIYDFLKTRHIDSDRLVLPKNSNCTEEY